MIDVMKMESEGAKAIEPEIEIEEIDEKKQKEEEKKKEEEKAKEEAKLADNDEDKQSKDTENLFDINNSMIDFRYLIIGQKLQTFKQGKKNYRFDDYTLSIMISNMASNTNIFNQTSVKRLIDH